MVESLAPPLHKDPGIQGRRRSHPPVRCRPGFSIGSRSGYWSGFTNASCAPSLASSRKTTCQIKKKSPQESQPARLASGAAALGWPCHKDGRRTHAQSSLPQRAPRRKAQSWCSKKALQRLAEETDCKGGNQPSVMAAGGLGLRQLALIIEESQL